MNKYMIPWLPSHGVHNILTTIHCNMFQLKVFFQYNPLHNINKIQFLSVLFLNNQGSQILNISGVNICSIHKSVIDQKTTTLEKISDLQFTKFGS